MSRSFIMSRLLTIRICALAGLLAITVGSGACSRSPEARFRQHMERGKAAMTAKEYRKAVIEFKVASQNAPKDPEALYQLGMACLSSRDGRCAIDAFERTLRLSADHEGALYQMGRIQAEANQPEILATAAESLDRVIAAHPANEAARYARAMVDVKLGKKEEAISAYQTALAMPGHRIEDVRLVIGAAVNRKELELAKQLCTLAVSAMPRSVEMATTSAEVEAVAGHPAAAEAETQRALALNPKSRQALELRMREELTGTNPDKAEATAKELAALPDPETRSMYADLLAARGKQDQALKEYAALRTRFPADDNLQHRYAETLLRAGHAAEAKAEMDAGLKANPKRSDLLLMRTRLSLDEGRTEDAGRDIAALEELKFRNEYFSLEKARYHTVRGERAQAGELLTDALRMNPRLLPARLQLARLLTELGKPAVALEMLDAATEQEQASPRFASYRTVAMIAAGDLKGARKSVNESLLKDHGVDTLVQDATLRMQEKDIAGAEKSLREALAKDPGYPAALAQMGSLFRMKNQALAYLKWLEQQADQNPKVTGLQLYAGQLLRDTGNFAAAQRMLERASANGAQQQANVDLAALEIREGKLDAAKARLEAAIKNKDGAYQRALLADVFVRRSDWANAEEHLRAAVRLAPGDSTAVMNLASVISNNPKRLDEAMIVAERALSMSPGNPALENSAGWLYYRTRHYPNAVTHLEAALRSNDSAATRYRLAAACMMAGDRECAATQYQTALKQNPKDPERDEAAPLLEGKGGTGSGKTK